jgi:hypothetical protein
MPKNFKKKNAKEELDQELSDFEIAPALETAQSDMTASDTDFDQEESIIQKSLLAANRKGKKSGGFQSMGMILYYNTRTFFVCLQGNRTYGL